MKKFLLLALCGTLIGGAVCLASCANGAEYSVTCENSDKGSVIVADTSVKAGEKVILASHPSAGYKLTAFLVDGEEIEGVSFVMPEKDVTVSAQFEAITYSVTYVLGDMTVADGNPETYTVENAAELIAPEKEGYEVCGWYTYYTEPQYEWEAEERLEECRVTSLQGLYGNLTLYAKYYNPLHEIILTGSDNGWYYVEDSIGQARYGDTIEITLMPENGYELDKILVNGEETGTTFLMPACDIEIEVTFKPIEYAITYELDGGENSPENPDYYTVEDGVLTLYDPIKDGYIFDGWYYDEDYENPLWDNSFNAYEGDAPITVYALWIPDEYEEE